jgi:hypothetical protein
VTPVTFRRRTSAPRTFPGYLSFAESTIAAVSSRRAMIAVMMRVSIRGPHPT